MTRRPTKPRRAPMDERDWWNKNGRAALVVIRDAAGASAERLREIAAEAIMAAPPACGECGRVGHTARAHRKAGR